MKRQVAALILNRNRYLITKINGGALAGAWDFPAVTVTEGDDAFAALTLALKAAFDLEVFPYKTDTTLTNNSPAETPSLTLIKCSISSDTKARLAAYIPSHYKWLYVYYTSNINLIPSAAKICAYLTKGKTIAAYKPRGFALMSTQTRKQIASRGGRAVQAMGKAHKWTSEEARKAAALAYPRSRRRG